MCLPVCVYIYLYVCVYEDSNQQNFFARKTGKQLGIACQTKDTHKREREKREREREESEREMAVDCSHNIRECINLHGKTRT